MTPEICSVAGRRSGIAAVMIGDSILPRATRFGVICREARFCWNWLPEVAQDGLGVSEVLAAFVASLATTLG